MRKILGCFIFIMIMITSQIFAGTIYYVDATNGSDSNSGTSPEIAWKTINKVNNSSFSPGDSILFKRGETWNESLVVHSDGSVGNFILFSSYGTGNNPVIDGSGYNYCIANWGRDYIKFENIEVKNANENGICISKSYYNEIVKCKIHDNKGSGICISGGSAHTIVNFCIIYENGNFDCCSGIYSAGNSSYGIFSNNIIYKNYSYGDGRGITLDHSNYDKLYKNTVYNNGDINYDGTAIELYGCKNAEIYQNLCYASHDILEAKYGSNNNIIFYNIFYGANLHSIVVGIYSSVHSTGNKIYNNTFDGGGIAISSPNNIIKNNIVSSLGSKYALEMADESSYGTMDYNCYEPNYENFIVNVYYVGLYTLSEWQSISGQDINSIATNTIFTDEKKHNYTLQLGSPCID